MWCQQQAKGYTGAALFNEEAALILLNEVAPFLPLYATISGHYWWPWIKNYYAEVIMIDGGISGMLSYAWIDQDLKKEMGY